jgi:hypothetical protein
MRAGQEVLNVEFGRQEQQLSAPEAFAKERVAVVNIQDEEVAGTNVEDEEELPNQQVDLVEHRNLVPSSGSFLESFEGNIQCQMVLALHP